MLANNRHTGRRRERERLGRFYPYSYRVEGDPQYVKLRTRDTLSDCETQGVAGGEGGEVTKEAVIEGSLVSFVLALGS